MAGSGLERCRACTSIEAAWWCLRALFCCHAAAMLPGLLSTMVRRGLSCLSGLFPLYLSRLSLVLSLRCETVKGRPGSLSGRR